MVRAHGQSSWHPVSVLCLPHPSAIPGNKQTSPFDVSTIPMDRPQIKGGGLGFQGIRRPHRISAVIF